LKQGACLAAGSLFHAVAAPAAPGGALTFVAWNLRNYLHTVSPPADKGARATAPKPEKEIAAVTQLLAAELKPDILGVCEIGGPEEVAALRDRLRAAGLDLPHTEHVDAADEVRHLALLSRFPIVQRQSHTRLSYLHDQSRLPVQRGFLDVTLQITDGFRLRCLGAHLKSRLATPEAHEHLMRRHEAHLLRRIADTILTESPDTPLLLYGDLNDTPDQPAVRAIPGQRGTPNYLTAIIPADDRGERWTHYYDEADTYARIDYLYASRALLPYVDRGRSHIPPGITWSAASDHRPVALVFDPARRPRR
jgi:endonuclease/exonuclease/phosphatase family metal-dependent hydrolase